MQKSTERKIGLFGIVFFGLAAFSGPVFAAIAGRAGDYWRMADRLGLTAGALLFVVLGLRLIGLARGHWWSGVAMVVATAAVLQKIVFAIHLGEVDPLGLAAATAYVGWLTVRYPVTVPAETSPNN